MGQADLQEAVARAIADAEDGHVPGARHKRAAAVATRVVLAEAQQSIEALGTDWTHIRAGVTSYEPAKVADFKREALAVLAALEPPPPV